MAKIKSKDRLSNPSRKSNRLIIAANKMEEEKSIWNSTILGLWLCENFDVKNCCLVLSDNRKIKITKELIHQILGIPMGDVKVVALRETTTADPTTAKWRASLPLTVYDPQGSDYMKKIPLTRLELYMIESSDEGWAFKVSFLVAFFSIFAHGNKDGTVNQRFLPSLENIENVQNLDWCTYCLECMKKEITKFNPTTYFAGPILLLALIYVNSTISTKTNVKRRFPAFKAWNTTLLNQRQKEEIEVGFGQLRIVEDLELIEEQGKQPDEEVARHDHNVIHIISRDLNEEMLNFSSNTAQAMKDNLRDNLSKGNLLLIDFDYKMKIALDLYPDDDDIKKIVEERNKTFFISYKEHDKDANVDVEEGNIIAYIEHDKDANVNFDFEKTKVDGCDNKGSSNVQERQEQKGKKEKEIGDSTNRKTKQSVEYYHRKVILSKQFSEDEKKVLEYLRSSFKHESDIVFKTKHYKLEFKFAKSLFTEVGVAAPIVDAWSIVLNHEEKYRKEVSDKANIYCSTGMLPESLIEDLADEENRKKKIR